MQRFALIPFIVLFATIASAAEPVKVFNRWDGKVLDEKLKKLAPEDNIISDQKTLETVWKAWRDDEVPKIDFSQSLILVGTVPGPNRVLMRPLLEKGDLRFLIGGTRIGGPGFGYAILQIPRKGIETVNGQPIHQEYVHVEVKGHIKTGIVAAGGETTGTIISVNDITWELDFGKNEGLSKLADKLSGKLVVVKGKLERKAGVEIKERWIVHVSSLEPAGE